MSTKKIIKLHVKYAIKYGFQKNKKSIKKEDLLKKNFIIVIIKMNKTYYKLSWKNEKKEKKQISARWNELKYTGKIKGGRWLMVNTNKKEIKKLTRGTKALIKEAIMKTKSSNRYDLCEYIANELEERFKGDTLTYQLERMDLETTGKILAAIDTYIYKHMKDSDFEMLKEESEENQ